MSGSDYQGKGSLRFRRQNLRPINTQRQKPERRRCQENNKETKAKKKRELGKIPHNLRLTRQKHPCKWYCHHKQI